MMRGPQIPVFPSRASKKSLFPWGHLPLPPHTHLGSTDTRTHKRAPQRELSQMPHLPGTQQVMRCCAGSRGP